jgi:hypothetical protein
MKALITWMQNAQIDHNCAEQSNKIETEDMTTAQTADRGMTSKRTNKGK